MPSQLAQTAPPYTRSPPDIRTDVIHGRASSHGSAQRFLHGRLDHSPQQPISVRMINKQVISIEPKAPGRSAGDRYLTPREGALQRLVLVFVNRATY